MMFEFKKLPKSLQKILNQVSKEHDFNIKGSLKVVDRNGNKVVYIDNKFETNSSMYRMKDPVEKIISDKTAELPSLIHKVWFHLFGDNVSEFYNIHPKDKDDGSWEIVIENPTCDNWLSVDVFLIPKGFEI